MKTTIVSRGYTGDFDGILKVDETMDPCKCGDEPLWLKKNTSSSVYVGRNRHAASQEALNKEGADLVILDDGFQHRKLHRDFDLILIDASAPEKHEHFLPMGRLREGFSSLKRAQAIIINKCNYARTGRVDKLKEKVLKHINLENLFFADFCFSHWEPVIETLHQELKPNSVALSCGVGNPGAFVKTVEGLGLDIKRKFIYPDHYFWKPADIEKMTYHMKQEGLFDLVMTEKDAVKLVRYKKHFEEMGIQLWVCKMKVQLKEREADFFKQLNQLKELS